MSQLPVDSETTFGFEAPRNTQFTVFLDNRVGKLLELIKMFQGQQLAVAGFSVHDSADHAVVRIVTSRGELARRILTRNDMPFSEADVLVVELNDGGHTMAKMCSALMAAELNIHYAYSLYVRPHGLPVVVLHCDDQGLATQILIKKHFMLLGE